ncbi:MAG: hypothetical protein QGI10_00415 [Vicinamibacterales bacterium]|nr:hypothetical protein [Vicinamibacterales bacterium]HJN45443.1 hypothetical protein [Vicinamibacterales bacterium]
MADVVFVHGLGGHPVKTWWRGSSATFWPRWVWEDLNRDHHVNVYSLAYPASPSHWVGSGSMALGRRAGGVLELFRTQACQRPIFFICHSLGGLLVKQMLRLSAEGKDGGAMVDRTAAVVFVATPHLGAGVAKSLGHIENVLRLTESTKELRANSPLLDGLAQWYSAYAPGHEISTYAIRENDKIRLKKHWWQLSAPLVMVVEPGTANPNVLGAPVIDADGDHFEVCKPVSRNARIHKDVRNFLEESLAGLGQRSSLRRTRLSEVLGGVGDDDARCFFVMSCFRDSRTTYPKPEFNLEFEGDTVSPEDAKASMWLASLVTTVRSFKQLELITTSDFKNRENNNLLAIGSSVTNDAARFALDDDQLDAPFRFHQTADSYRIECRRCGHNWYARAIGAKVYVPGDRTRPDYGIVVKAVHGSHTIITVAGLGPVGTLGAAYYLLEHWEDLWQWYADRPFGVVLEYDRAVQNGDPSYTLATIVHHTRSVDAQSDASDACGHGPPLGRV